MRLFGAKYEVMLNEGGSIEATDGDHKRNDHSYKYMGSLSDLAPKNTAGRHLLNKNILGIRP